MSELRITSTELGDAATSETGGQVQVTSYDGGNGIVQSVVGGTNVTVDSTDPAHPIVSATGGGGGGGAVDSVNGQTGVVVLAAADVGADASGAAAAAQAAAIAASQPLDADLTAIAALATTTFGRALLALADAAALRTSAGLGTAAVAASTDFDAAGAAAAAQAASQPLDSDLTAIAALTTTSYGRAFLALADAAAGRTALGLGTAATSASSAFEVAGAAAAAQAASQPLDSDLTAIAALTTTTYGRAFLALADATAGRTALGLGTASTSASTDFQPLDSDLTAIAALSTTSFGRSFLALADAAAGRTLLGLGTLATQSGTFSGTSSGTNTGDQTVTLTGDVTGSGTGSFAATIKTSVALAGSPTTTTQAASDNSTKVATTAYVDTGLGTKATALTRTAVKTGNYTAVLGDLVPCDTSAGAFTVTLPAASGGKGRIVVKLVTAGNTLNLALTGSDHFNTSAGPTTGTLTLANQGLILESDGSSIWTISADDLPLSLLDARYVLESVVTTKGDLLVATGSGVVARHGVGTDGQALVADSAQADGVKWGTGGGVREGRAKWGVGPTTALSMPGVPTSGSPGTQTMSPNRAAYTPFRVLTAITIDQMAIEVTTSQAASHMRLAIYAATSDWQPTGVPLVDSGAVDTSSTGVKTTTVTSTTLQPGIYLFWTNADTASIVVRSIQCLPMIGYNPTLGGNTIMGQMYATQTYGAPPSTPLAWDTTSAGTMNMWTFVRESAA